MCFFGLGLSTSISGRHQESGFLNLKETPSSRIAIICDIVLYSQADVCKRFGVLLYVYLQIQNEWSGEWYGDHSPGDVVAKKCVALYSTAHVPLRYGT
jgi:hypothetical protein